MSNQTYIFEEDFNPQKKFSEAMKTIDSSGNDGLHSYRVAVTTGLIRGWLDGGAISASEHKAMSAEIAGRVSKQGVWTRVVEAYVTLGPLNFLVLCLAVGTIPYLVGYVGLIGI